jgi:hypothetical protein
MKVASLTIIQMILKRKKFQEVIKRKYKKLKNLVLSELGVCQNILIEKKGRK